MGQKIKIFLTFAVFALGIALLADPALASPVIATGDECSASETLGSMICNVINSTTELPFFITGFAYIAGMIFGFLGIVKLRDHVESPHHAKLGDSIKRFAAGGAFFALPAVVRAIRTSIEGGASTYSTGTGFNGTSSGTGLDSMIVKLVSNVLEPIVWATGWLSWIAGLIFVLIAISRIVKSEQDGPRGPTGLGTITTILIAGALFSLNSIISFVNTSIFDSNSIRTYGVLQYTQGLGGSADHVHAVISAIIGFSYIIGVISVARSFFIFRGVSEGNSQASMMSAMTHLIGGVLAINLGAVIMAVQKTLGLTQYGITF